MSSFYKSKLRYSHLCDFIFSLVFSHTIFHELRNLKHCRNCQSTNGGVNAWFKSKLLIVPCSAWLMNYQNFLCSDEDQPYTLDAN